jgi:hypothetical protein
LWWWWCRGLTVVLFEVTCKDTMCADSLSFIQDASHMCVMMSRGGQQCHHTFRPFIIAVHSNNPTLH